MGPGINPLRIPRNCSHVLGEEKIIHLFLTVQGGVGVGVPKPQGVQESAIYDTVHINVNCLIHTSFSLY